jgi:molybdopterin-guanine dinucleotide biosynthesis protein A
MQSSGIIRFGGVVLCGGKSTRMGLPKATLPFGDEVMLERVVRLLKTVVRPIVVVAAGNQSLPALPQDVLVTHDRREERGPLEGILAGLSALRHHAHAAYVTSCDVPLLEPNFVRHLTTMLNGYEIVVPFDEQFPHPLAALYRVELVERIESLLRENRLRPIFLFDSANTLRVPVEALRDADPQLTTLQNLNHPQDYFAALETAGLPVDPMVRSQLKL